MRAPRPRPHPRFARFVAALRGSTDLVAPWSGTAYRSVSPQFARSEDLLSGAGSLRFGGRWHPGASFKAVYATLDPETAMSEALAHCRYYRLPERDAMPRVFVALDVGLEAVLHLGAAPVVGRLGVARSLLVDADWRSAGAHGREALTQALGRAAFAAGLEGILVPSAARRGGLVLVAFRESLRAGSVLRLHGG